MIDKNLSRDLRRDLGIQDQNALSRQGPTPFRNDCSRKSSSSSRVSMDDMQEMYSMLHENKEEFFNEIENIKENHKKEMNQLKKEMRSEVKNVEIEMTNQNLRLYEQINFQREEMAVMNDNQTKFFSTSCDE